MEGNDLRSLIILATMLILMASSAMAFGGAGSVVVDIVGSNVEDTTVVADGRDKIDLEIIGSTAKNTTVSPYQTLNIYQVYPQCPPCPTPPCPPCPTPICPPCPTPIYPPSPTPICPPCTTPPCPPCPTPVCPPCPSYPCPSEELYKQPMPWDNKHLGVDAWYGAFWYRDNINMPKWPQF